MAKTPKLRLLDFVHSLQVCRDKDPTLVSTPLSSAKTYMFSPAFSPKSYDISFPSFPDPPPSTPTDHYLSSKLSAIAPSRISPSPRGNGCDYQPESRKLLHGTPSRHEDEFSSHANSKTWKKDKAKMCNSPIPSVSDRERQANWSIAPASRSTHQKKKKENMKQASTVSASISSVNSDNETDYSIFSSAPSPISSHHQWNNPLKAAKLEEEVPLNGSKKIAKPKSVGTRRFKRFGSKEWKDGIMTAAKSTNDHKSRVEKLVARRSVDSVQRVVDGKGKNSFVVVKNSVDPYEDFKKSMLEMILEKQIFEPKELEQLLMSFLSLNSRIYHRVIIEAFTEIWKELFCGASN